MFARSTFVMVAGIMLVTTSAFAGPSRQPRQRPAGVNARQHRQVARIKDGVKDGEVTRGELNRLKADEAAIRAEERVFRNSGNGLSKQEKKELEKDLNQTSREIFRAKHNDRQPGK